MHSIIQLMRSKLSWGIWNNYSILHKHSSKSSTWSVTIHLEILAYIWENRHSSCNQMFLQLLKTGLTFLSPFEFGVLLQQLRHGLRNLREILNEPPVVSCKSKKTPDLSNWRGCFPFSHSDNLGGVYYYSFSGYIMSEESNFLQPKFTLAELNI